MRIRTIKPEFFMHDGLYDLEQETGLPIRVAWAGLWCAADREGRFKWSPKRLGAAILPYDGVDFSRVLDALTTRGFLVRYASPTAVDGDHFGWIPTFLEHQVINNREKPSSLPDPAECTVISGTLTRAPRVADACPTPLVQVQVEGKGREGKGREDDYVVGVDDPPLVWSPENAARAWNAAAQQATAGTVSHPLNAFRRDFEDLAGKLHSLQDFPGGCALLHWYWREGGWAERNRARVKPGSLVRNWTRAVLEYQGKALPPVESAGRVDEEADRRERARLREELDGLVRQLADGMAVQGQIDALRARLGDDHV